VFPHVPTRVLVLNVDVVVHAIERGEEPMLVDTEGVEYTYKNKAKLSEMRVGIRLHIF
jgi:hypothetical protein